MADERKGITMDVYRSRGHAGSGWANGGLSEKVDRVTVVGIIRQDGTEQPMPKGSRVFEPTDKAPAVVLVERWVGNRIWHVQPVTDKPQHFMHGGAYVATSDSRIDAITGIYGAISLHDRTEW